MVYYIYTYMYAYIYVITCVQTIMQYIYIAYIPAVQEGQYMCSRILVLAED